MARNRPLAIYLLISCMFLFLLIFPNERSLAVVHDLQ